jgi:hypothetical protein
MRDRFFYPIATALIAGLITLALVPGPMKQRKQETTILNDGYHLAGDDLKLLQAAAPNFIEYVNGPEGEVKSIILYSNIPRKDATPSAGVFRALGSRYERIFGGQNLEISVRARAGAKTPLDKFDMGYFTGEDGDSGWQTFELSKDYQDFMFSFTPNPPKGPPGRDYVGIWPGKDGNSRTMEVERISIKIIAP